MDDNKISIFLSANADCFKPSQLPMVKSKLKSLDDEKLAEIQAIPFKKPGTMLLISIFLAGFGLDRFLLGDIGMGVLKVCTCGCCGFLSLYDIFTIKDRTRDFNFSNFQSAVL